MTTSVEEAASFAKKYLEDLLSFFGLNIDAEVFIDEEVIRLNVPSSNLNGFLIGQKGENVRALQFLVSTILKNKDFQYSRVNIDIANYKLQRADRLRDRAAEWMKQVKTTGQPLNLEPMNAADRRVIHQLADEYQLISESQGEGRQRHVIIKRSES